MQTASAGGGSKAGSQFPGLREVLVPRRIPGHHWDARCGLLCSLLPVTFQAFILLTWSVSRTISALAGMKYGGKGSSHRNTNKRLPPSAWKGQDNLAERGRQGRRVHRTGDLGGPWAICDLLHRQQVHCLLASLAWLDWRLLGQRPGFPGC